MTGWIKLHRSVTENEFYFEERFTKIMAWLDLLILATHMPKEVIIKGKKIDLKPGELCWSQVNLAKRWQWNRKTVLKYLKTLETNKMVDIRITSATTIINITNWAFYQVSGENNKPLADSIADGNMDTNAGINKKDKNIKKCLNSGLKNFSQENNGDLSGKNLQQDPYSVKSRLAYRPDPEKSRARLEELREIFGHN